MIMEDGESTNVAGLPAAEGTKRNDCGSERLGQGLDRYDTVWGEVHGSSKGRATTIELQQRWRLGYDVCVGGGGVGACGTVTQLLGSPISSLPK